MILVQVGFEVFHHLVYCVSLFFNGGVVDFGSLHSFTHEGDGASIVQLILLSEYCNKKLVEGKGV